MSNSKMDLSANNIATCVVYGVIGLLLIILQGGSLGILMTIVGALLIALGVIDIVKNKDVTRGVIEIVVGALIIVFGWVVADIVLLILGILLIVYGSMEIYKNYKSGFVALISPIVTIVVGILLVIAKWTFLDVICIIAGVICIINAVLVLFGNGIVKSK